jgi:hypothetical protein
MHYGARQVMTFIEENTVIIKIEQPARPIIHPSAENGPTTSKKHLKSIDFLAPRRPYHKARAAITRPSKLAVEAPI